MTIATDIATKTNGAAPPADPKQTEKPEGEDQQLTEREVKAAASARGWVPKGAFKGDPDKWIDAPAFLERAENEMPLLKANLRKMEKQYEESRKETKKLHELLKDVVANTNAQADRAVEQAIAKLKEERKQAAKEGDTDKVERLSEQIEDVKATKPVKAEKKEEKPEPTQLPEEFNDWLDENKWFKESKRMNKYAEGVWQEAVESNEAGFNSLSLKAQLAFITKEVKKEFPDKFGNPRRREAAAVEGAGNGNMRGGGKGYEDLPQEAKDICNKLVAQKVLTRDEYVKNYRW